MIEMLLSVGEPPIEPSSIFLGEVPVTEFITGDALASTVGLTAGTSINSNEPWLKFELDSKILYVAKKPFRCNLSWTQLNAVNLNYGDVTVEINNLTYKVRLLKGSNSDPYEGGISGHDTPFTWGSEWNLLFYPLIPFPSNVNGRPISSDGIVFGSQASYTEADLVMVQAAGDGSNTWCQEAAIQSGRTRRGLIGVVNIGRVTPTLSNRAYGWRPCLELVN